MKNKIIDTERKTPGEIMKMLCINFSIAFGWFPTELPSAWLIWNVTYVVILALSSVLFTGLYRRETKLLNKQLERYKSETAKRRK